MRGLILLIPLLGGCDILFKLEEVDTSSGTMPAIVQSDSKACTMCDNKSFEVTLSDSVPATLLLVHVASSKSGGAPAISSVSLGTTALEYRKRGMAASAGAGAVLELWTLTNPPSGISTLTVNLGGTADSLIVGVTEVEGASETTPIRLSLPQGSPDMGKSADNLIQSTSHDLVVDAVCAGGTIESPGDSQTLLFLEPVSSAYTCGNLAGSWAPGQDTEVPVHWNVNSGAADHWIDIATSIAPAD
jgi:hypothetical protein